MFLETAGAFIAPATLLTGLAFYIGWTKTVHLYRYFGIDVSTLEFSTNDYLLRSVDALFIPFGFIFSVSIAAFALHALLKNWTINGRFKKVLTGVRWAMVAGGLAVFVGGAVAATSGLPWNLHFLVAPLLPAVGIGAFAYGIYLHKTRETGEAPASAVPNWQGRASIAAVIMIVILSLFWTASNYARALGQTRATELAQELRTRAEAVLYSNERLHIERANLGIHESRMGGRSSAYRFRYDGLRLLIRTAGKYFLVPANWSSADGVAILLPDADTIRVEFVK